MLGYITVNRDELKVKDLAVYQAFYCGVCQDIRELSGQLPRFTLTYDMTFLAILLTSLYGGASDPEKLRCILHPMSRKNCIRNRYTRYAADMCVVLTYHNLMDDWLDEGKKRSVLFADVLRGAYRRCAARNARQTKALMRYIRELHKVEKSGNTNLDLASGLTGTFFSEVFRFEESDIWSRDLGAMGFYLGKFIYLMDAYDDVEKDKASGNYNPFLPRAGSENFAGEAKEILSMMMSAAAAAFERLPIVDFADILKNILYSGVWGKFNAGSV